MRRHISVWPLLAALTFFGTLAAGSQYNCEPIEPPADECYSNADCEPLDATSTTESAMFCEKALGDCDGVGTCAERPVVADCPRLWAPVCGCDGETYDNACFANVYGASVDYDGECEVQPDYCWSNDMCAEGEYCFFADCALETGVCAERPEACYEIWAPVCGCDGETYANDCFAAAAGVSVDYEGECETPYCWSNDMCAEGEYCFFADCALETGECMPRPEACIALWDPVCGCDGQTYSNACYAASAGVSVDYEGECEITPTGCWSDDMCAEGEYCFYAVCAAETGACVAVPDVCPYLWDPVCGCDGETYANACLAATAHVSVDYEGACRTD